MANWTRDESLIAFNFYCRTPFGRLHGRNPNVIQLAQKLGRTPGAVAMKCCNFASLDSRIAVSGLKNVSNIDRQIWQDFQLNSTQVSVESQTAFEQLMAGALPAATSLQEIVLPIGPTEKWAQTRVRLVQSFFRATVLSSYNFRCAMCGLDLPPLISASHIIPWSHDENRRADPTNGLSLCALHDRAFDRGYLALDDSLAILVSPRAKAPTQSIFQTQAFAGFEGKSLILPERFAPDAKALDYHRRNIFH